MQKTGKTLEMELSAETDLSFEEFKKEVLKDYKTGQISRQLSLIARKEVLSGKAKFGIFGDGKEVAQLEIGRAHV